MTPRKPTPAPLTRDPSVRAVALRGRVWRLAYGPGVPPLEVPGPTAEALDRLERETAGARLVRRVGPCGYVVVR